MPVTTPLGLIIGLAGGLASAVLFYSAVRGSPTLSVLLLLLSPLPTLIAALGWGMAAATTAAIACALAMLITVGLSPAVGTLVSLGLPALGLSYLAFLSRPTSGDPAVREWYPAGRILAAIGFYGAVLPLLMLALSGASFEDLRPVMGELLRRFSRETSRDLGWPAMTEDQLKAAIDLFIFMMPGAIATYWTAIFCLNTYLAARVAKASGRLVRDWPDLPSLKLPRDVAVVFAIALLAMFATGLMSVAGVSFVGALSFVFFLAGLALVHSIARRRSIIVLILTYASLIIPTTGALTAAILVLCGIGDTLLNLKGRLGGPRPAT